MKKRPLKYFKDIAALLKGLKTVSPLMSHFHIHKHEDTPSTHVKETTIFRSNTYSVLFLEEGEALYKIGLQDYHMTPGSFFFHSSYHLRYYKKISDWKGYVVLFDQQFMNKIGSIDIPKEFPFYQIDANVLLKPLPEYTSKIKSLLKDLHAHYYSPGIINEDLLFHYLNILLHTAKELYLAEKGANKNNAYSRPIRLAKSFETLLEEHFFDIASGKSTKSYTVHDFASALSITPNHLSEVVKNHFGKTPTQLIKDRQIIEAQSLLRSTDLSVSEIAYFLHFNDSSNFAKFFKKNTHLSPIEYRKTKNH